MNARKLMLAAALTAAMTAQAHAQTISNRDTAQLLSTFTQLNSTAAGRQALADNLAASITVNNTATQAQRDQAVADNNQFGDGRQFTLGLGSVLDARYQQAVAANQVSAIGTAIGRFTSFTSNDSSFGKTYFANGSNAGTIALPPGGAYNVYDLAYGVNANDPGQNPNGNSRPFQVRPAQINNFAPTITAGLATNSAFPSGHTTFGTTIALIEAMAVPERFSQEIARGLDYGYSRVVLGAHYAADVIGGRILAIHDVANMLNGAAGYASTTATSYAQTFDSFRTAIRSTLGGDAGIAAALVQPDTGRFGNAAQVSADAAYRADYGVSATGATNLAAVVPTGAEVLLATRFTYLNAEQRRDVLATTEFASGGFLDDGSGWARLDLFSAGHGYGAFNGAVVINQDATLGGLAAADSFTNNIAGSGSLRHLGSGQLTLTGLNTFSGGTFIDGGTLVAGSLGALGNGGATLSGGTLAVGSGGLLLGGAFSQTGGVLSLTGVNGLFSIGGNAALGGTLLVNLANVGFGSYQLLSYGSYSGSFADARFANLASGAAATLNYRSNGLYLTVAAASAVPEPASWAMMIAGFALVGVAVRRRPVCVTNMRILRR